MKVSYHTKLSGTSFKQEALKKVIPNKTLLRVIAHGDNEYDPYAVEVQALLDDWEQIGWIQKGKNKAIWEELMAARPVSIVCTAITGEDKQTLGCNVGITYGEDDSAPEAILPTFDKEKVIFGDEDEVYFDAPNHEAYSLDGYRLLSGSRFEKMFLKEFNPEYPAKALSKTTGAKKEDIVLLWEHNRDLAADYGTLIHKALQWYYETMEVTKKIDEAKERHHSATHWMPTYLGVTVDKFVLTSGIGDKEDSEIKCEARIKYGSLTGICDNLEINGREIIINDYKVTQEIKDVKYDHYGKLKKYTLQQNFYRHILEALGYTVPHMRLWQWNGNNWSKHELEKIDLGDVINEDGTVATASL